MAVKYRMLQVRGSTSEMRITQILVRVGFIPACLFNCGACGEYLVYIVYVLFRRSFVQRDANAILIISKEGDTCISLSSYNGLIFYRSVT